MYRYHVTHYWAIGWYPIQSAFPMHWPIINRLGSLTHSEGRWAIRPFQLPWCNAVVLVRKKVGSLWFCIDFQCLNTRMKRAWWGRLPFLLHAPEEWVLTAYDGRLIMTLLCWKVRIPKDAIQPVWHAGNLPASYTELPGVAEPNVYLDDVIVYSNSYP